MTRSKLDGVRQECQLDPARDRLSELVLDRDGHAASGREGAVRLDDPEGHEQAGNRRAVVDPAERIGDAAEGLRPVNRLVRDR